MFKIIKKYFENLQETNQSYLNDLKQQKEETIKFEIVSTIEEMTIEKIKLMKNEKERLCMTFCVIINTITIKIKYCHLLK